MIEVRQAKLFEIPAMAKMDQDADTGKYILPYSLAKHREEFERPDAVYLSILDQQQLVGYFILVLEADETSVEFRRIVVAKKGAGIGQQAIPMMEDYCRNQLKRERLWLDVFDFNQRGQHLYQKLGYRKFDNGILDGKILHYYQKTLASRHS